MTDEKDALPPLGYTFSDRALDEDPSPWDIGTIDLLGYWREIQNAKKGEQPEPPEWTSLEMSYLAHLKWRFDYPKRIANQQLAFTWIMTVLVLALVVAGLIFSFLQLDYALKVGDIRQLQSEAAIETAGNLSFRSSVMGTAVLVISLAFYYLYLQYIFSAKQHNPPHLSLYNTDAPRLFRKRSYLPPRRRNHKKAEP